MLYTCMLPIDADSLLFIFTEMSPISFRDSSDVRTIPPPPPPPPPSNNTVCCFHLPTELCCYLCFQYVAAIPQAIVEGEAGLVYDRSRNVYHETHMFPSPNTGFVNPMPQVTEPDEVSSTSLLKCSILIDVTSSSTYPSAGDGHLNAHHHI